MSKGNYYSSKDQNLPEEVTQYRLFDEDGNELWIIEQILDKKWYSKEQCYKYKVKWKGWPMSDCTWEPIENLETVEDLVQEFDMEWEQNRKNKKGTLARFC